MRRIKQKGGVCILYTYIGSVSAEIVITQENSSNHNESTDTCWQLLIWVWGWCIFSSFEIERSLTMAGFINPSAPPMDNQFSLPTSTVEMSIRCTGLADCDWLSKSDPVAIIFGKLQGQWSSSRHVFTNFPDTNLRFFLPNYLVQLIEHPILEIPNILFVYLLSIFSR